MAQEIEQQGSTQRILSAREHIWMLDAVCMPSMGVSTTRTDVCAPMWGNGTT